MLAALQPRLLVEIVEDHGLGGVEIDRSPGEGLAGRDAVPGRDRRIAQSLVTLGLPFPLPGPIRGLVQLAEHPLEIVIVDAGGEQPGQVKERLLLDRLHVSSRRFDGAMLLP
jgi:hypothetical protein